ncbi:uncharacterized protein [Rutidosis leptorrhynchoides]|uniref:uncharacterized protein n=1 Tax=Rutidosis leptorrhynchoides TaxID=125765 RepID=UPI003A9A09DC
MGCKSRDGKKADGSWRMCVDYKDINKACPKDNYPMPKIDWKVSVTALTRFLSRAADRALPFFQMLKGCLTKKDFIWTDEAEKAFQDVKAFLKELPTLTAPIPGETLTIPCRLLRGNQLGSNCPQRRLRRYFQTHLIQVFTDQPIKHILTRPEISGKMAKWAIELGEHEITFLPKHSVKGQVIADFLAELPSDMIKQGETTVSRRETDKFWELYTDGVSSEEGADIGLLLVSLNGEEITYAFRLKFATSNNYAEYEALIARLRLAKSIDVRQLTAYIDLQLVASQLNGSFEHLRGI